ncbi:minor tail protein [Mycobacterium phage MyraDee]|uniref:Minor tail protein n=1 Tax=Mycobacterium phage MyraDee TaxID=2024303 RepID=A0A222YZ84_9CAUD|nr:minor tail protein [Mycobacterium phage MyraDee]ASR77134.1 minor tail protein [Mycobacterium phage MyraDee]
MHKPIPSQQECDPTKPEEHALWALRSLPSFAGSGVVTHSGFLRLWSKHLWEAGFAHRDYLEGLADEDGNIHVSRLPKQQIRFQDAFRGPHHTYNNAARWVRVTDQDPEPIVIPNIQDLTIQEQHALLYQFQAAGMVPDGPPKPNVAQELNEGH